MPFTDSDDLTLSILPRELSEITGGDASIVTTCLSVAESEARSYLYDGYDVDAIFGATGADRFPMLVQSIADIAIYYVVARCQAGSYLEDRMARYDRAIRWLKMVQKSELFTDLPRRPVPAQPPISVSSNRKRRNYY
jgi:phage gp36-like protein